jgi:hypothetical protein
MSEIDKVEAEIAALKAEGERLRVEIAELKANKYLLTPELIEDLLNGGTKLFNIFKELYGDDYEQSMRVMIDEIHRLIAVRGLA